MLCIGKDERRFHDATDTRIVTPEGSVMMWFATEHRGSRGEDNAGNARSLEAVCNWVFWANGIPPCTSQQTVPDQAESETKT